MVWALNSQLLEVPVLTRLFGPEVMKKDGGNHKKKTEENNGQKTKWDENNTKLTN